MGPPWVVWPPAKGGKPRVRSASAAPPPVTESFGRAAVGLQVSDAPARATCTCGGASIAYCRPARRNASSAVPGLFGRLSDQADGATMSSRCAGRSASVKKEALAWVDGRWTHHAGDALPAASALGLGHAGAGGGAPVAVPSDDDQPLACHDCAMASPIVACPPPAVFELSSDSAFSSSCALRTALGESHALKRGSKTPSSA
eukprot:scaffold14371_cov115-Isochrysis_galbana.AAC.6